MMDYFMMNEQNDFKLLQELNQREHLFATLRQTKPGHHSDAVATKLGMTYNIEIKRRYCEVSRYDSVYIEDYKVASLMMDYAFYGCTPLYICIYNDGILVFNLLKLKLYPKIEIKNIESKGKEKMQMQERRYCLKITDAIRYERCQTTQPS